MRIASRTSDLQSNGQPVCGAIGIFDGVHLGHQQLLLLALAEARRCQGLAAAITFDRHPNAVLAPDRAPALIQSLPQRLRSLAALGLDVALVLPFTPEFSCTSAEEFIGTLARDAGSLACLCVGEGFTFGHRRTGTTDLLRSLGAALGFQVHPLAPVCLDGVAIRSTRIRDLIRQGDFANAARCLGRPYTLVAKVIPGDQLGRTLGFPTANLDIQGLVLPPHGVYAVRCRHADAQFAAVLNLGLRPTLQNPTPDLRCEVHLLDFDADLYHQELEVEFVSRLRPEQRFDSADALRNQIARDVARARTLLT